MAMLDQMLSQLSGNVDVANLASKLGIAPDQAEAAVQALGHAHHAPGDTIETAAANTGLSPEILQQMVAQIGGEGALSHFASLLTGKAAEAGGVLGGIAGALDKDGDGNPLNDLAGLASGFFGKK